jgi:hypothetical protein
MKKKKRKSKIEFSKKLLIALLAISFFFTLLSYVLAFLDKQTVENLSIEILRIIWVTDGIGLSAYSILNGTRAWSLNKYVSNSNECKDVETVNEISAVGVSEEYDIHSMRGS